MADPPNAFGSKYLLTGFVRRGCCGSNLVVRSRSHGRQRGYFYARLAFHHRGRVICANSLDAPLELVNDVILGDIEQFVRHLQVVSRARALVLEELQPARGVVQAKRSRLQDRWIGRYKAA